MWFKQIQVFQLTDSKLYTPENIIEKLQPLVFKPCPPSMASSIGWTSPVDEPDAPIVRAVNGYIMFCLQFEEKILPATVVRQELSQVIKRIEVAEDRKLRQKEKLSLKDEVILNLLPRAFSKLTRVYAYLDTKNQWLVLGTTNANKTEQFLNMFKKSITESIETFELKKLAPIITHWLKHKSYPTSLAVEKSAMLQDAQEKSRIIRCQQQDLFASSIQSLIKDGCEVKQIALTWQDRVKFILSEEFLLRSISFEDEVIAEAKAMEPETKQQQLDADFFIMSEILSGLLHDLLELFLKSPEIEENSPEQPTVEIA